jgi:hypothetical protein
MRNGHVYFFILYISYIICMYDIIIGIPYCISISYHTIVIVICIYICVYLSMKMFTIYNMGLSDNGLYLLNGH